MPWPRAFLVWGLALFLAQQLHAAHAIYEEGDGVMRLTSDTFEKEIIGSDGPALVRLSAHQLRLMHVPSSVLH
jgi:hypothetical protein